MENPTVDNPILENPTADNPTSENPMQLNKDIQKTDLSKKEKSNTDLSSTHSIPILSPNPSPLREETAEQERKGTEAADAYSVYEEIIKDNIEYEHFIKHIIVLIVIEHKTCRVRLLSLILPYIISNDIEN